MRLFTLLCCFFVATAAFAHEFTVGTVDLQQLFKDYPGTKKAQKKFNEMADKKKQDLTDSAQELRDLEKQMKDSSSVLSKSEMDKMQSEYTTKSQSFQDQENQVQTDLANEEQEMTQTLLDQIKLIVAKVAKENSVDLVLDSDKTVYTKNAVDLTADVLKKYNNSDSADDDNSDN